MNGIDRVISTLGSHEGIVDLQMSHNIMRTFGLSPNNEPVDWYNNLNTVIAVCEKNLPGWLWLVRGPNREDSWMKKSFANVMSSDFGVVYENGLAIPTGVAFKSYAPTPGRALLCSILFAFQHENCNNR